MSGDEQLSSRMVARRIPAVSLGLAALYAVLALAHWFLIQPVQASVMFPVAAVSSGVLFVVSRWTATRRFSPDASAATFLIVTVTLLNSAAHLYVVREDQNVVNLLMLTVCSGIFLVDTRCFLISCVLAFASWLGVSLAVIPDTDWVHYGFAWLIAVSMAMLAHQTLRASIQYVQELLEIDERKTETLERALHDAGREIEERERVFKVLRRAEAKKTAILNSSINGIIEIGMDGAIVDLNSAVGDLLDYQRKEIIGRSVSEVMIPEELRAAYDAGIEQYVRTGQAKIVGERIRLVAVDRLGVRIPVEVLVQPVEVDGQTSSFVGFIRDIRTQVEAEKALQLGKEEAERASAAKSALIANVSHELRTPMNSVLGMTELVLQSRLTSSQRQFLSRSRSAAENLLWMLDDLLSLAKIESGRDEPVEEEFDLVEVLERATASLALDAEREGLRLELVLAPEIPTAVVGDALHLRQVLNNLLGNAIKYTSTGWVRLEASTVWTEDGGYEAECVVSDTGPGIPEEERARIFGSFEQLGHPNQNASAQGGVGLGLSIAARCVRINRSLTNGLGELVHEPRLGGGSRFRFRWCLKDQERKSRASRVYHASGLVVGRRAAQLDSLHDQLEALGVDCHRVDTAEQIGPTDTFDIAVVDCSDGDVSRSSLVAQSACQLAVLVPMEVLAAEPALPKRAVAIGLPVAARTVLRRFASKVKERVTASKSKSHGASIDVLVVDDDESNRVFLAEALRRMGHRVLSADDGYRGIACYETQRFDLVIVDYRMPDLDGLETVRRMQSLSRPDRTRTSFQIVTAHAGADEHRAIIEAGLRAPWPKPLRIATLLELVNKTIADRLNADCDFEALIDLFEGDIILMRAVFDAQGRSYERDLENLERLILEEDAEGARALCHKLQGGLGDLAMVRSVACVDAIRICVKSDSWTNSSAHKLFEELSEGVEAGRAALEGWIDERSSSPFEDSKLSDRQRSDLGHELALDSPLRH